MQIVNKMPHAGGISPWRIVLAFFLVCVVIALCVYQVSSILGYRQQNAAANFSTSSFQYSGPPVVSALMRLIHQPGFASTCNHTGVTLNQDGSYTFDQLNVTQSGSNWIITGASACPIYLRGANTFASDTGAEAKLDPNGTPNTQPYEPRTDQESNIDYVATHIPMNVLRLSINPVWWNQNVTVPDLGFTTPSAGGNTFHYQDYIKFLVSFIEKHGWYVELDEGPQFLEPPCDQSGTVTPTGGFCPQQSAGGSEYQQSQNPSTPGIAQSNDPDCNPPSTPCDSTAAVETSHGNYISAAQSMWSSIASYYAKNGPNGGPDTAVIYDTWNESHDFEAGTLCTPTPSLGTPPATPQPGSCPYQWEANQDLLFITAIDNAYPTTQPPLVVTDYNFYDPSCIGTPPPGPGNDYCNGLYYSDIPNLVLDHHFYDTDYYSLDRQDADQNDSDDGPNGSCGDGNPPGSWNNCDGDGFVGALNSFIADANNYKHAVIINEWGDFNNSGGDTDAAQTDPYNYDINSLAQGNGTMNGNNKTTSGEQFGLVYYDLGNLTSKSHSAFVLNCEGVALLNDNLNVWGSPPPGSVTPTVTPTPTPCPTPQA